MTRIYQLDTISQDSIKGTHVIPSEDNAGADTTQITLGQLSQYFFNNASTTDDSGPLSGYPLVVGNNSVGQGTNVTVFGPSNYARTDDGGNVNYATAIGYQNHVFGNWGASSIGYRNNATVSQSSAFGHKNTANARLASAFGTDNLASGEGSSAFGRNNTTSDYGSVAAGYHNTASGEYATAVGADNSVVSYNAQAFGCYNTISAYEIPGNWCTAIGAKNTVFSPINLISNTDYNGKSTACGYHNIVAGAYNTAVGANNLVQTEGFVIKCSAVGYGNTASGYWGASAFGYINYAQDIQCSAFGHKNTANSQGASAFGNQNTASGQMSVAFGNHQTASSIYSSTFGVYNSANGSASTAAGYGNTTGGNNSSCFGYENVSIGNNSSAIGFECQSVGDNSSALGFGAISRPVGTTNIGGAIVTRADNSESYNATDMFSNYAGVQNIVMTAGLDMTHATFSIINVIQYSDGAGYQVGDTLTVTGGNGDAIITVASVDGGGAPTGYTITNPGTGYSQGTNIPTTIISSGDGDGNATVDIWVAQPIQLTVPTNCLFYPDEIGLITTGFVNTVTSQPSVEFGWNGTLSGLLASVPTINLTQVGSREVFTSLLTYDGKSTLTFSVTAAASATALVCRAYFKGILIENTPIG